MNKILNVVRVLSAMININRFNNPNSQYHLQSKKIAQEILLGYDFVEFPEVSKKINLKLQWYMVGTIFCCDNFNMVTGHYVNDDLKRSYYLSGVLGALGDIIVDDIEITEQRIALLKSPPIDFKCNNEIERLFVNCYHLFIDSVAQPLRQRAIYYYELAFDAQLESKRQFEPDLTKEEADEICRKKNGYSFLFLRSLTEGAIDEIEEKALYEMGAFIQFCNDAQDIHKDTLQKIRTFATTSNSLQEIADNLNKQKSISFTLFKSTNYEQKRKDDFLIQINLMHLAIVAKLKKYHEITAPVFSFEKLSLKSKEEIKPASAPLYLFQFIFGRSLKYSYENAHLSIQLNLS